MIDIDTKITAHEARLLKITQKLQNRIIDSINDADILGSTTKVKKLKLISDVQGKIYGHLNDINTELKDKVLVPGYADAEKFTQNLFKQAGIDVTYSAMDKKAFGALRQQVEEGLFYINGEAVSDVSGYFYDTVLTGTSKANLARQIRNRLTETGGTGPTLARHAKTYAQDMLMEYSSRVNYSKFEQYDIERFFYYGSLMKTSRPWCKDHAGKEYTKKEIMAWQGIDWKGKKSGNPFIVRGGWNCRHHFRPVTESMDLGSIIEEDKKALAAAGKKEEKVLPSVPFKTIEEAETQIKKEFGIEFTGFEDIDVINEYAEALQQVKPTNVTKIKAWDRNGGQVSADIIDDKTGKVLTYEITLPQKGMKWIPDITDSIDNIPDALNLFYDENYNYKIDFIKNKFSKGTSVKNTKDIALHELGHAETFKIELPKEFKDWGELEKSFRAWFDDPKNKNIFSAYGMTDYSEALAEAAVEAWNNTYKKGMLPDFLEKILFKAIKK